MDIWTIYTIAVSLFNNSRKDDARHGYPAINGPLPKESTETDGYPLQRADNAKLFLVSLLLLYFFVICNITVYTVFVDYCSVGLASMKSMRRQAICMGTNHARWRDCVLEAGIQGKGK